MPSAYAKDLKKKPWRQVRYKKWHHPTG